MPKTRISRISNKKIRTRILPNQNKPNQIRIRAEKEITQKSRIIRKAKERSETGIRKNPIKINQGNAEKKTSESDSQDPEAYRMDKKKLRESGLNEEQAKNMLKAMRQSEIKYLQQRQFRGKNNQKVNSGPRW